ncbi:MlaD family protein [uncultured Cohaesibacter sp.]|uniref:MlaD family protein n=1 Tax=uncultured Cohaesibacter sp. TaxID=1002546 RepID=UPI0029C90D90|nr:MlaD family protein [uncultured Cohaesibacter sp.]
METKANFVAIGLFTLILTAVGFGFIYWIARFDDVKPMREVVVRFEGSVAGLFKGGQVLFNGIKVGEVNGLNYDPDDPKYVRANLSVDSEIPLKQDSRVELSFQGLTGVRHRRDQGWQHEPCLTSSISPASRS